MRCYELIIVGWKMKLWTQKKWTDAGWLEWKGMLSENKEEEDTAAPAAV